MILAKGFRVVLKTYLFAALFGVSSLSFSNAFSLPFKVGDPFPKLTLPTLEGDPLSVQSLKGKKTVLHIFASW